MQLTIRDYKTDKLKSAKTIAKQLEIDKTCVISGCDLPITVYHGPGEHSLCREHQVEQREYGGLGRLSRPWTFSREWTCKWCGYNPKQDPWFDQQTWSSDRHKYQAMRAMLVGDHQVRRVDGGNDSKQNVQTFCQNCNAKKTVLNNDHDIGPRNQGQSAPITGNLE